MNSGWMIWGANPPEDEARSIVFARLTHADRHMPQERGLSIGYHYDGKWRDERMDDRDYIEMDAWWTYVPLLPGEGGEGALDG